MRFSIRRKNKYVSRIIPVITVILILGATITARAGDVAAPTPREVFINLRTPPLEVLKKTTRLDMLDYWDADSVFRARNVMNGKSWIEAMSDTYARIRITPVSVLEVKILPVRKGNPIVMTIYTVGGKGQAKDSSVDFFDSSLKPLSGKNPLPEFKLKDFISIPKGSSLKLKDIENALPFSTVEYTAGADSDNITGRLTVADFLGNEEAQRLSPFILPQVTLRWNGTTFIK